MGRTGEPDQRDIVGYSIRDRNRRERWIALVRGIADFVDGWRHEVVFHGTSDRCLESIMARGMAPTDTEHATDGHPLGSFWGDVYTASSYAEDTVKHRGGGYPVLIAARTADLLACCETLVPDLATLDYPLKGLTRLDDTDVYSRWVDGQGYRRLGWRDALEDLRAVVAVHRKPVGPEVFVVVDSLEVIASLCLERTSRAVP